jgi:hypothetical protein
MLRALVNTCLFTACALCLSIPSAAQEIIHALTGTVSSIDSATKTMNVLQDSGSTGTFELKTDPKTRVSFDKRVEAESTAASGFDKQGAYVIVFYYGQGDSRTAVALKALGNGPFSSAEGTVMKYDGHSHSMTVQDKSGALQTFKIDPKTVAESELGAIDGTKFHADKGDHVRVVSTGSGDAATAVFVRDI